MKHKNSPAPVSTPQISPQILLMCPHLGQTFKCNTCDTILPSIQSHARHIIDVHPEQTHNICDYCPTNDCSNFYVANEGCDCPCDACEERM